MPSPPRRRIARLTPFAALAVLALLQSSCATLSALGALVQKPRVNVRSVDLTSVTFEGLAANIVLGVDNPNPIGVSLGSFAYNLTVDGHQFAAGRVNNPVNLPAQGSGTVTIPVGFKFLELAQALTSLFTKDTLPFGLSTTLGFSTPIGLIQIPLSHQGTFPVPKVPTIALGSAEVAGLNVSGATLRVNIAVANPNGFQLPAIPINFKASLNGTAIATGGVESRALPANSQASLPLTFNIPFNGAAVALAGLFMNRGNATFAFEGGMNLPGLVQPYKFTAPIALR